MPLADPAQVSSERLRRSFQRATLIRSRPYPLFVKSIPEAGAYEVALRTAVLAALAQHPADAASVTEGRNERDSAVWGMEVEPTNPAAASVYVSFAGGDEVTVGFGRTHAYIWDDDPAALAAYIGNILTAVFAGDFEEAGLGDAFARVHVRDGTTARLGNMHLPLPWRLRRQRRYAPLSESRG